MRPSPFMHLQGQIPGGVQLLKDGRLAHGMDINGAAASGDPRLNSIDMCNQGQFFFFVFFSWGGWRKVWMLLWD